MKSSNSLSALLAIGRGAVVSVVGAGGKTSTILRLARELRAYRTLVTTTTKMGRTGLDIFDRVSVQPAPDAAFLAGGEAGLYFAASRELGSRKLLGFSPGELSLILAHFDIALIEADGSAQKPLKGWKPTEPVILPETGLTLGLLAADMAGQPLVPENVHNSALFSAITGAKMGDILSTDHLLRLICHPNGLFQNARGRRALLFNRAEDARARECAQEVAARVPADFPLDILAGSAHDGEYWRIR